MHDQPAPPNVSLPRAAPSADADPRPTVGVVGLGLMGTAISERLLEHGYTVRVWNRSPEKADSLAARGAVWSDNPFADCDRVIVSLYTSEVVAEVVEHMRLGLRGGQIVVDTTTGEPADTAAMGRRLAAQGVQYLDAPISGSSEQTRRGEAVVMVGGDRAAFDACADLWPVLGRNTFYLGLGGSASKMKLVTNLVLGLNRAVLAEGLAFARAVGVDPTAALEVLRGTPAYSKVMDVKGRKMVDGDFSVQARLVQHLKDVLLILKAGDEAGQPLPLSSVHRQLLEQAEAAGLGELDNSAIVRVWNRD